MHAAHFAAAHQRRSQAYHHHGLCAKRDGSAALDRAGHDLRQGARDARESGHATGPARLGRGPPHRPGVEHRLL